MIEIKQYRLTSWARMGLREANPGEEDNLCYVEDAINFHKKCLRNKQQEVNSVTKDKENLVKQYNNICEYNKELGDMSATIPTLKLVAAGSITMNIVLLISVLSLLGR